MRWFQPSPAMGVALAALVLAMAGTGMAARSYVVSSGSQIRDGTVSGADIRNASLTGAAVRNRSLTGTDIRDGSLSASDFGGALPPGPQGPPGPKGDAAPSVVAVAAYDDTPPAVSGAGEKTLLTLGAPTGSGGLVIHGKVTLENTSFTNSVTVDCFLRAGSASDESRAELAAADPPEGLNTATLPFTLATTISPGEDHTIRLTCDGFGVPLNASDAKLNAIASPVYIFDAN